MTNLLCCNGHTLKHCCQKKEDGSDRSSNGLIDQSESSLGQSANEQSQSGTDMEIEAEKDPEDEAYEAAREFYLFVEEIETELDNLTSLQNLIIVGGMRRIKQDPLDLLFYVNDCSMLCWNTHKNEINARFL